MLTQNKYFPTLAAREDGKVWSLESHCWLQPKRRSDGYYELHIESNRYVRLHRVILSTFKDPPDGVLDNWEVDHQNQDRSDNRLENLRYVTREQNMQNLTAANHSVRVTVDGQSTDYINMAAAAKAIGVNRATVKKALDDGREEIKKNGIKYHLERIKDIRNIYEQESDQDQEAEV